MCAEQVVWQVMEDTIDLGDTSHCPSTQLHVDTYSEFGTNFVDTQTTQPSAAIGRRGRGRSRGRSPSVRSLAGHAQSHNAVPHKLRGPNWTKEEMLVLIGQKRIEWDGRHNCSQPSLAKFVYGTTAWNIVLAGCMAEVGFWERNADQLTNKWDGLIKDYKKLKDYVEGTGSANWWGMNREEKRDLCKNRNCPCSLASACTTNWKCLWESNRFLVVRPMLSTPTAWGLRPQRILLARPLHVLHHVLE